MQNFESLYDCFFFSFHYYYHYYTDIWKTLINKYISRKRLSATKNKVCVKISYSEYIL